MEENCRVMIKRGQGEAWIHHIWGRAYPPTACAIIAVLANTPTNECSIQITMPVYMTFFYIFSWFETYRHNPLLLGLPFVKFFHSCLPHFLFLTNATARQRGSQGTEKSSSYCHSLFTPVGSLFSW